MSEPTDEDRAGSIIEKASEATDGAALEIPLLLDLIAQALADARRSGAEWMRERAASATIGLYGPCSKLRAPDVIRALPLEEEPTDG